MKLISRATVVLSIPVLVVTLAACSDDDVAASSDSTGTFSEQAGGDVVSSSASETEERDVEDVRPTGPSEIEGIKTFVDAEPTLEDVDGVTLYADDGAVIRCDVRAPACVADRDRYWPGEVKTGPGNSVTVRTNIAPMSEGGVGPGAAPTMPEELPELGKGEKAEFIAPGGATNQYGYIAWDGTNIIYATVPDPLGASMAATITIVTPDGPLQAPQQ